MDLDPAYALDDFESYPVGAIAVPDGGYGWQANGIAGDAVIRACTHRNGNIQNRLELGTSGNAYYRRKLGCDNGWTLLRVVFALRIAATGNKTGTFCIGAMGHNVNGITYGALDGANAPNWIGMYSSNGWAGATANWVDTVVGTTYANHYVGDRLYFGDRTGAATNDAYNALGGGAGTVTGRFEGDPVIGLFQVGRVPYSGVGAVNYTVTGGLCSSGNTGYDRVWDKHEWKDLTNGVHAALTMDHWLSRASTWAFEEAGGELDALEFAWNGNASLQVDYISCWQIQ
jgi:hypothetical protein